MSDLRLLTSNDLPQARHIWSVCFGDPPEFIKWYFDTRVKPGRALGLFEDGELISDTLMIPYRVRIREKYATAPYIVGAATLPEHRRKGHMERVLQAALAHMRDSGAGVTFLHPFRNSFYHRLGWENATRMLEYTIDAEHLKALNAFGDLYPIEKGHAGVLQSHYMAMASQADPALIRSERECSYRIEETLMEGGFGILSDDAYALCSQSGDKIDVHELIYNDIDDIYPLLFQIARERRRAKTVSFAMPACEKPPERLNGELKLVPYMMMRVVDVETALSGLEFFAPDGEAFISVIDALCPWNNGVFRFKIDGGVSKADRVSKRPEDADAQVDVRTLAALISGYTGFDEAAERKLFRVNSGSKLLSAAFSRLNGFILEKY